MHIAIATFSGISEEWLDDGLLSDALRSRAATVTRVAWDRTDVDWASFDAVIIRSTWDYTARHAEFVDWIVQVGSPLHNAPALVRWNSDKRYLADLAEAGLPVVPTTYLEPGDTLPDLTGDIVVKPSISAGAKDTGRFGNGAHDAARHLVERIHATGRTVMLQPYVASVDTRGEIAVVCIDGSVAYSLHKGAVLRADEVAPLRDDELGVAEAMYDETLVVPGEADDAELGLALAVVGEVSRRFGYVPLYARVDMVTGSDGSPVLMELEAVEPSLYHGQVPGSAELLADAIVQRVAGAE